MSTTDRTSSLSAQADARAHELLRHAAVRATLAPSVHNTQPWKFVLGAATLDLYADATRQLHVLDPDARQLTISCGCALFTARTALAAVGIEAAVQRMPDDSRPDLLARLSLPVTSVDFLPIGELDAETERRHTNRRQFFDETVSADVRRALIAAAAAEGAELMEITTDEQRAVVASLSREADDAEMLNPAYRAELRA